MTRTAGCSTVGSRHVVKAGGGRAGTPDHAGSLAASPGASCAPVLQAALVGADSILLKAQITAALVSAGSIFLKAQITASDIREESLDKAYLLKYV